MSLALRKWKGTKSQKIMMDALIRAYIAGKNEVELGRGNYDWIGTEMLAALTLDELEEIIKGGEE